MKRRLVQDLESMTLKSWIELEVFSLEMRRLRRNIFPVGEKLDIKAASKPFSMSTRRRE